MAHYAKVIDGIVIDVIVAEETFFDTYIDNTPGEWIQTSYNTSSGVHLDGGTPLRKNYASIDDIYDKERDAFYSHKPYPSWTLNEDTCQWQPPVAYPSEEGLYSWNEETQSWVSDED
jgi:hypothetical protein